MKLTSIITGCFAFALLTLTSCQKEKTEAVSEVETTFALSANEGMAENLTQDANDVLEEAAVDNNFQGNNFTAGPAETNGILSCARVTVTPASGFPKNIVIDFGTGCSSPRGVERKGKILITLTDSLRNPGSVATMTFENYFVGGFKKEGKVTWRNTSTANTKSWNRTTENGKITAPNGTFFTHSGVQDVVQTRGANTPRMLLDDVFSITGNRTVTNAEGKSRVGTILEPLQKKTECDDIDKGIYRVQGPNHVAIINYGDGRCDKVATISIDGGPARTFLLR